MGEDPRYCRSCVDAYLSCSMLPRVEIVRNDLSGITHFCLLEAGYWALCGKVTKSYRWTYVSTRVVTRKELKEAA